MSCIWQPYWAIFSCKALIFWVPGFASMEIIFPILQHGIVVLSMDCFCCFALPQCPWHFPMPPWHPPAQWVQSAGYHQRNKTAHTIWGQAALLRGLSHCPLARCGAVPISPRQHQRVSQEKAGWPWDSPALGMPKEACAKSLTASQVLTPASDCSGRVTRFRATAAHGSRCTPKLVTSVPTPGPRQFLDRPNRAIKGKCVLCSPPASHNGLIVWEEHS